MALGAHAATAAGLASAGVPTAWDVAADWMTVWGTAVDLGSLTALALLLRREGLTLLDLCRAAPVRGSDVPLAAAAWTPATDDRG